MSGPTTDQDPEALADGLNELLDELHDPVVSGNPFEWTDTEARVTRARETLDVVRGSLTEYRHRPRLPTRRQVLFLAAVATLAALAGFTGSDTPDDGLRTAAFIVMAVLLSIFLLTVYLLWRRPAVDIDLALAAYVAPRGWSFSRLNGLQVWKRYAARYGVFRQGDKKHEIKLRIWGYMDDARTQAFQMFHFRWVDVEMRVRSGSGGGKGSTRVVAEDVTRNRFGIFVELQESQTRFRMAEGKSLGFEEKLSFEYTAFNKAVNVYCDAADELAVRQFLSPAVLEIGFRLTDELTDVVMDFFPGHVMVLSRDNFVKDLENTAIDAHTARFEERIAVDLQRLDGFRRNIGERIEAMRQYND